MTKEDMIKMVESRIKTEYDKYHNTPVDFVKSAAIKIVLTLEEDSKQVKNNVALDSVVGQSEQLVCKCGLPKDKKGGNFNCTRTDCDMPVAN